MDDNNEMYIVLKTTVRVKNGAILEKSILHLT